MAGIDRIEGKILFPSWESGQHVAIDQRPQQRVAIDRPSSCLRCHVVYSTLHVPGMLARSSFIAPDGLPLGQFGGYDADDRTPFRRRWGGWYVTGTHGAIRHMGNALVSNREDPESAISDRTLNRTSLEGAFDSHGYLSTHSDIAALMVFQHQSHMTNLITRLGWEARMGVLAPETVSEFVDYLLFVDEQPLTSRVKGGSGFAARFRRKSGSLNFHSKLPPMRNWSGWARACKIRPLRMQSSSYRRSPDRTSFSF